VPSRHAMSDVPYRRTDIQGQLRFHVVPPCLILESYLVSGASFEHAIVLLLQILSLVYCNFVSQHGEWRYKSGVWHS
jgi:hypothetical protein